MDSRSSTRLRQLLVVLLIATVLSPPHLANAEEDPFPGVADGAEVSQRQILNKKTGDPADGSAPIQCPSGSGSSHVADIAAGIQYRVCKKNWRPTSSINADKEFREKQDAAIAAAQAESKAWNAANPGKQKCVQWGPIVHANGVSTASGGVCANPVEPGPSTTVASQDAPSVQAPTSTATSSSSSSSTPSTSSDTKTATTSTSSSSGSSSGGSTPSTSSDTKTATTSTSSSSQSSSSSTVPTEDFSKWGSGTPYTRVLKGQLSTSACPSGFQAANGLIAAIGVGTFTECWPENAWAAYRLGGSAWEQFKSSGGTYDAKAEIDRRNKVAELKALAKSVAQTAADQTPGIQRCSRWTGYGESGQECAYTFVKPNPSASTTSSTSPSSSETRTATTSTSTSSDTRTASTTSSTSTSSSETSTATSSTSGSSSTGSTQANSNDPFPNIKNGEEIPNTRVTSAAGIKQSDWEQSSTYKSLTCPVGSGKASGVDLNFTVSQSDDRWYAYCVKSFQQSTTASARVVETSTATTSSTRAAETSTATSSSTSVVETSTATSATSSNAQPGSSSTKSSSTGSTSPSGGNEAPTLQSSAVQVKGSVDELKDLASKVLDNPTEKRRLRGLLNKVDGITAATSSAFVKLPGSSFFEESVESKTLEVCTVSGIIVNRLKKGTCVVSYTITDSNGNKFTTDKEIIFRR